jgi:hypothetical protein
MKKLLKLAIVITLFIGCKKESNISGIENNTNAYVDLTIDGVSKSRINIANIGGTGFGPTCTKKVFDQHVIDNDNSEYSVSISFLHAYLDKDFQSLIAMIKQKPISDSSGVTSPTSSYCGFTSALQFPYIIISYKDNKTNTYYMLQTLSLNNINSISNITKVSTSGSVNNYLITGSFKSVFDNFTSNKIVKVDGKYKFYINTYN